MKTQITETVNKIMTDRFGHDSLIALATTEGDQPYVRAVNAYYENGSFYVITYAKSNKMKHIEKNSRVSICGDWLTAQGEGINLGHIGSRDNKAIADVLKEKFSSWYQNGHINESDPNTCILRIALKNGVLSDHGTRYELDFSNTNK